MKYRETIVKQAKEWVGKKESDGSFKEIIDIYNSQKKLPRGYKMKYTDHWCATFVTAVAIKCGYTSIIPPECGCEPMINLFKKMNRWVEDDRYEPQAGDIIFYDWNDSGKGDNKGWSDHVGIVETVHNGLMTIIEGNISEKVGRRSIRVNGKYIRGYGVPKYDAKKESLLHEVGDIVHIKEIFVSSTSEIPLRPAISKGKITKIYTGRRNPYLLNDGDGFVNDKSIIEEKPIVK